MQHFLMQRLQMTGLRAYFIWAPILGSDTIKTARENSRTYATPNSVHYWTPTQKLAKDLAPVLRMGVGRLAWDIYLLYPPGVMWDREPPAPSYWQRKHDIPQGDAYNVAVLATRVAEVLRKN